MSRRSVRFLVFGASLRQGSLNDQLAALAAATIAEKGGRVEIARMQ